MRFNPRARIDSSQIEDRGSSGGGGGFGGGGGGMGGLPIPIGGRSIGSTIVIILIYVALQYCTGGGMPGPSLGAGSGSSSQQPATSTGGSSSTCQTGEDANRDPDNCGIDIFTNSVQDFWARAFPEQTGGSQYQDIVTVKYQGQTNSGCGQASSAMGPFYCPNDQKVYIDTGFMKQMLEGELGAKGGTFALGYVIAHEYGHHIEDQLGWLGRSRTQQGANSDSVKIELGADCLAGVWAKDASQTKDANGQVFIEDLTQDDIKNAIDAAQHVGDDYIQKRSGGQVNPDAWTHGSSAERVKWFNVGLRNGSIKDCDTWAAGSLE